MITLIDYGAGNLHSLQGALTRLGFQSVRAVTPADAPEGGALVLPGVGHFTAARAALVERGWWDVLPPLVAAGRPLLGICLGLQLLAEGSEESPGATGLGLVPGVSRLLGPGVKVPNMGWARVKALKDHPALPGFREDWLYFVHSYALDTDAETVLASTHGRPFAAMQARGRVMGFQGHPEKSGAFGESLLRGVLGWMGEVPCA
jgi:imidazole glycerol phosphate synthase glutamine amidotransferase subunit